MSAEGGTVSFRLLLGELNNDSQILPVRWQSALVLLFTAPNCVSVVILQQLINSQFYHPCTLLGAIKAALKRTSTVL